MKIKRILKDKGSIVGMAIFPFILVKKSNANPSKKLINHERIHLRQQAEMLFIPFFVWYGLEWLIKSILRGKDAYKDISFEREAFANEYDLDYLKNRKFWSWIKYL